MIIKILSIAIISIFASMIIKKHNSDIALLITIVGAIIIFMSVYDYFRELVYEMLNISSNFDFISEIIEKVIKAIGIGYLTEFASDIADDSGSKTLSNSIVICGKILIVYISIPIIKILFESILSLI